MLIVSWKAVEMQVALPRTQDVGRIQEQIQQRGQFMQDVISHAQLQAEQTQRQTVTHLNEGHKINNDEKEESEKNEKAKKRSNKRKRSDQKPTIQHPYLGTKIDING